MEKAICPICKKPIEVNVSEKVDFCKLCGKPIDTWEAVKLYKNSRKPSDEIIEKFNAILAQDYKLAKEYLYDVIAKEYPVLRDYSSNKYIAEMIFKVSCAEANVLLREKWHRMFSGGLPGIKMGMMSFMNYVDAAIKKRGVGNNLGHDDIYNECLHDYSCIYLGWETLEKAIENEICPIKMFDDEFIFHAIDIINDYANTSIWKRGNKLEIVKFSEFIPQYLTEKEQDPALSFSGRNLNFKIRRCSDLITRLESFLSSSGKIRLAAKKETEERYKEQQELARKKLEYQRAYDKELPFWQQYVELLKAGKVKRAHEYLLNANKSPAQGCEFSKFKHGLFSVKYTGDVNSLKAETLTELAVKNLKL